MSRILRGGGDKSGSCGSKQQSFFPPKFQGFSRGADRISKTCLPGTATYCCKQTSIMDSSICVATMTGFPWRLQQSMMRFCVMGTSSGGISTPRSPLRGKKKKEERGQGTQRARQGEIKDRECQLFLRFRYLLASTRQPQEVGQKFAGWLAREVQVLLPSTRQPQRGRSEICKMARAALGGGGGALLWADTFASKAGTCL